MLTENLDDPKEVAAIRDGLTSREAVTPEQVRAVVGRFAGPSARPFEIRVLPAATTPPPGGG